MKVWGLTAFQIEDAILTVSDRYARNIEPMEYADVGRAIRVKLGVKSSRAPGASFKRGRRISALCWHGFRDVIARLFKDGATRVQTVMADYRGLADFEAKFPATGHVNVGSMTEPLEAQDACQCHRTGQ